MDSGEALYQCVDNILRTQLTTIIRSTLSEQQIKSCLPQGEVLESCNFSLNQISTIFRVFFLQLCPNQQPKQKSDQLGALSLLSDWIAHIDKIITLTSDDPHQVSALQAREGIVLVRKILDFCRLHQASESVGDLERKVVRWSNPLAFNNLPTEGRIVSEFIGRGKEIAQLHSWLTGMPDQRRWALCGYGGKGKTAVAYKLAYSLAFEKSYGFDFVIWMSAKMERFLSGQVIACEPDFWDLESGLDKLLHVFEENPDKLSLTEKQGKVIASFKDFSVFLVLDDIDSIKRENSKVVEFLLYDVLGSSMNSRILITSRLEFHGLQAATTNVQGLQSPDDELLIAQRCKFHDLDENQIVRRKQEILEATDSSPLYIIDLLRLAKTYSIGDAIHWWKERGGDKAREFSVAKEFESLKASAQQMLLALSLTDEPCSYNDLEVILDLSRPELDQTINELGKLFLEPERLRNKVTLNHNVARLVGNTFKGTDAHRRISQRVKAAQGRLKTQRADWIEIRDSFERADNLVTANKREEAEKELRALAQRYPAHAQILFKLACFYTEATRFAEARDKFEEAASFVSRQAQCGGGFFWQAASVYWEWSLLEAREDVREWEASIRVAEEGLKVFPAAGLKMRPRIAYASQRLATELRRAGEKERAEQFARRARDEAIKALQAGGERHESIFKSLVMALALLGDGEGVAGYLIEWRKSHRDSSRLQEQWQTQRSAFPKYVRVWSQ